MPKLQHILNRAARRHNDNALTLDASQIVVLDCDEDELVKLGVDPIDWALELHSVMAPPNQEADPRTADD